MRWDAGFRLQPEGSLPMAQVAPSDTCDTGAAYPTKTMPAMPSIIDFEPYAIWGGDKCSTYDRGRPSADYATRNLLAGQSGAIAHELWAGTLAQAFTLPNPYLAGVASTIAGGAHSPIDAIAALEQVYADHGGRAQPTIHCTLATMDYWQSLFLFERQGNVFLTANDALVIADAGYPGSGPSGSAPSSGHVFAYISPGVQVRLGAISVLETERTAGTPSDNLHLARAERLAAATFEESSALVFAVEINHPIFTAP